MKKYKISNRLFKIYGSIFSISISLLSLFFVLYIGSDTNKKIIATQKQMIININKNIENFFLELNDFSVMLLNSKEFKDTIIKELPNAYEEREHLGNYFMDLYLIAYRMIEKDYKIGVYTKNGDYVWLGNNYFIQKVPEGEKISYKGYDFLEIKYLKNNKYIDYITQNPPIQEELGKETICLTRTININNNFQMPQAILEVQVDYEKLTKLMEQLKIGSSNSNMEIFIYNKEGSLIYGNEEFEVDNYMKDGKFIGENYYKNNKYIHVEPIFFSGLYVISIIPMEDMYTGLIMYLAMSILSIIIINLLIIFITYKISIKLTSPIQEMCKQLKEIRLDNQEVENLGEIETDIEELDFLAKNISGLHIELRESLEQIIKLESYEIQSKMLALQAQMQPHFLYNTLITIGAMGEEHGNDDVANMCYNLTHMLRYISSKDMRGVNIGDEINHLERYISIMRERFNELQAIYDIPLEMMDISVPKLMLQPLVENSIKYCERTDCKIILTGYIIGNHWRIIIKDNGRGFEDETITEIMKKCEKVDKDKEIRLHIQGMGIANIYTRLKIFYGKDFHFKIRNNLDEGCCIEVGGKIGER